MSNYCCSHLGRRSYYWFEESVKLYRKLNCLVEKIKNVVIDYNELRELVQVDVDLIKLWKAFEKESMVGIDQINDGSVSSIKLPSIFGYPDTIYYYNGIILIRACRGDVKIKD